MNSGPHRQSKLSFDQVRQAIDSLHSVGPLATVAFAGGEPLLLGETLLDCISYADSLGLITRVVTNASWALTPQRGRATIAELRNAGLCEMNISTDDYHLPFIPFERVVNAWQSSKNVGFSATVIANCFGRNSFLTPSRIEDLLGEKLPYRFDDQGREQPLPKASADGTLYIMSNSYLQCLGRSNYTVDFTNLIYPDRQDWLCGGCRWAVRSVALSANNHLVACCGFECANYPILDFGNLNISSPANLIEQADDSVLVNAIALLGPMFLKHFIQERSSSVSFLPKYASVCQVCEHIVTRPEPVDVLRVHIAELVGSVLAARQAALSTEERAQEVP